MGISSRKTCVCSFVVVLLAMLSTVAAGASADGCQRKCGGLEVPYPFGLLDDPGTCYRDEDFVLTCNYSYDPPKLIHGDFEYISVSLLAAKMVTLVGISYDCGGDNWSTWNNRLLSSFAFSYTENVFTGVGCDTTAQIEGPDKDLNFTGGCLSDCSISSTLIDGECSGIGCCQAALPSGLQRYFTLFGADHNESSAISINPCSYSFLVQKGNYTFRKSDLAWMDTNRNFPVVIDWSIIDAESCEEAVKNKISYACISTNSLCLNSSKGPTGYICNCSEGFHGNPYILDGCQDINECEDPDMYRSWCKGLCINLPGSYSCICPPGTTGDPKLGCQPLPSTSSTLPTKIGIVIALCSGITALILSVGGALFYKRIQKRRLQKIKEKFFNQNYDMLRLQKKIVSINGNEDQIHKIKFFSFRELEKATDNFDRSRVIGEGAHGTVYKGLLELRVVAIKKPKLMSQEEIISFLNEVILLSEINHKNVVQLIGCCFEAEVPLLVYEFISNGTLSDHLHVRHQESPLSWHDRLRIATEISAGLAYLHNATYISILHRDIKSSNILLDERLTAKVSDFGASKVIEIDQTHISTNIQGTFGYLDPEYLHTGQLTDKSDVYSLGVILVELLT